MPVDIDQIKLLEKDIIDRHGNPCAQKKLLNPELERRRKKLLDKYLDKKTTKPDTLIHVIGDSHSVFFSGCESMHFHKGRRIFSGFFRARYISALTELLPIFRVFHVGPATAWQVHSPNSSTFVYEKIQKLLRVGDIPKHAKILLVFGEIDIRCHIPKAVLSGKSVEYAVNATVERFMRLPLHLKSNGYRPAVWHPSLTARNPPKSDQLLDSPLPYVGTQELRNEICDLYCAQLKKNVVLKKFQ